MRRRAAAAAWRGRGWHCGQEWVLRPATIIRRVRAPALEGVAELGLGDFPSVRAERPPNAVEFLARAAAKAPEAADVAITEFVSAVVQNQPDVRVRLEGRLARNDRELARHSQTQQEIPRQGVVLA